MPGMIAGATVGACVGAALLLAGVLVLMRRRGRRLEYLQQEKERRSAIDAYGRTGGMVNGF